MQAISGPHSILSKNASPSRSHAISARAGAIVEDVDGKPRLAPGVLRGVRPTFGGSGAGAKVSSAHWLKTLWMLRKLDVGQADCELWHHPLGRELRLTVNQDLLRAQVFKGEALEWVEISQEWHQAFEAKGWAKPPNAEPVGQV